MPKIYVITGGPGVGKTSLISELESRGFRILKEAAREVSKSKKFIGKSVLTINKKEFQEAIFNFQKEQVEKLLKNKIKKEIVFLDRGFGDTLVYDRLVKLKISKNKLRYIDKIRYEKVFILDFLDFYEKDNLRKESKKYQKKIHKEIISMYTKMGYNIVIVPSMSIEKRADFVEKFL